MNSVEFESLYLNLLDLSLKQLVWPSPFEMMHYANKWNLILDLDKIAEQSHNARPSSVLLEYGCPLQKEMVFKRTHSHGAKHVVLPRNGTGRRWGVDLKSHESAGPHRVRWICQEFAPLLQFGEFRTFIIDGKICWTTLTSAVGRAKNGDVTWTWDDVTTFKTLEKLG